MGCLKLKGEHFNCEVPTVGFPQNDCVSIVEPKRLDRLFDWTFLVEQNEK